MKGEVGRETGLSPPVKYFYWLFQGGTSFVIIYVFLTLINCWKRADLLALGCGV